MQRFAMQAMAEPHNVLGSQFYRSELGDKRKLEDKLKSKILELGNIYRLRGQNLIESIDPSITV